MFVHIDTTALPNKDDFVVCAYSPCPETVQVKKVFAFSFTDENNRYLAGFCCAEHALTAMNQHCMWSA